MEHFEHILIFIVGAVFIFGGCIIAKNALHSKNLIETAFFGLLGVAVGLFLLITALAGPPN